MYSSLLSQYAKGIAFCKPQPPATEEQVRDAEGKLNIHFPEELRNFLYEMNGDHFLCFSTDSVVRNNLRLRRDVAPIYPDLNGFLFIAENGCGDYYGYRIENGSISSTSIYIWEHEEGKVSMVAANLANLIRRYYRDEI